jgi:hypothetical protein
VTKSENNFDDFMTCTWCKKQVKKSDQSDHIESCPIMPASEKDRLRNLHEGTSEAKKAETVVSSVT